MEYCDNYLWTLAHEGLDEVWDMYEMLASGNKRFLMSYIRGKGNYRFFKVVKEDCESKGMRIVIETRYELPS